MANRPPAKRLDDYNESILHKISQALDYGYYKGVDGIIFSGDLFHTHRTNDELTVKFVDIVDQYGIDFYYLYGNHDIQGGNVNFIDKTNMGLLSRYPWFKPLGDNVYGFSKCLLTGINYSAKQEVDYQFYWPDAETIIAKRKKILVTHAMITNEEINIKGERKSTYVKDVESDVDLLLNGHFHDGHKKVVKVTALERTTMIVNPGALARMNLREAVEGFWSKACIHRSR